MHQRKSSFEMYLAKNVPQGRGSGGLELYKLWQGGAAGPGVLVWRPQRLEDLP